MLRIQNKNLSDRLIQRKVLEAELREKIEQLQNRKVTDDSKLLIVDRYWTQLDEDLRTMLERFDSSMVTSSSVESMDTSSSGKENNSGAGSSSGKNKENKTSTQSLRNFLAKLNDWDKVELEDNLKERVKFTTQTVSKLLTNYDR